MGRFDIRRAVLLAALAALPAAAHAQDAADVLGDAARAMRLGEAGVLRYTASGSGYEAADRGGADRDETADGFPTQPPEREPVVENPTEYPERRHFRIRSYREQTDADGQGARVEWTRGDGDEVSLTLTPESDWPQRLRLWTSPHGFVARALAGDAQVTEHTRHGSAYRVTVAADDGREVSGYVDEDGRLTLVRTAFDENGRSTQVESSFLDWRDYGGVEFPSTLITKHDGELVEVLIVAEVELEPAAGGAR